MAEEGDCGGRRRQPPGPPQHLQAAAGLRGADAGQTVLALWRAQAQQEGGQPGRGRELGRALRRRRL